jgi:hypothetical protein
MVFNTDDGDLSPTTRATLTLNTTNNVRLPSRVEKIVQTRPRGPPTPNMMTPSADPDSPTHSSHDPPPPPTPAASPGPEHPQPDWSQAGDDEDVYLSDMRVRFNTSSHPERTRLLADLLNICTSRELSFVRQYIDPLLKKDPFTSLPNEICLRASFPILSRYSLLIRGIDSLFHRRPESPRSSITGIAKMAGIAGRRCDVDEAMRKTRLWAEDVRSAYQHASLFLATTSPEPNPWIF